MTVAEHFKSIVEIIFIVATIDSLCNVFQCIWKSLNKYEISCECRGNEFELVLSLPGAETENIS